MMKALEKYMPEGTKWVYPDGGLFTWVELPGNIDTTELLKEAAAYKVAFVAGAGFYVGDTGEGRSSMILQLSPLPASSPVFQALDSQLLMLIKRRHTRVIEIHR